MKRAWFRTKIVCTIGPASASPAMLDKLVRSGMSVARLNTSHGSFEDHHRYVEMVRAAAARQGKPVAILLDLAGPKYRTGKLKVTPVRLAGGSTFIITTRDVPGDEHVVSMTPPVLPGMLQSGDEVLLGDGEIVLVVEVVRSGEVVCRVRTGGELKDNRGLTFRGRSSLASYLTQGTLDYLDFGLREKVDYFALSLIRNESDVAQVREVLAGKGVTVPLIAKIETREAVSHIHDIIAVSDAVMVARGDMGTQLPLERVPVLQKQIVEKCNHMGRPVIVATQMLESMLDVPYPTRAEVADIANAVFDGTDAVMLSGETAIGHYPQAAVSMMRRIAAEAEAAFPYERHLRERGTDLERNTDDAIAFSACHASYQLGAVTIVAFTESGSTALRVAKYRPKVPLLALTPYEPVRTKLALVWGVHAHIMPRPSTIDEMFDQAATLARSLGMARRGDRIIITSGVPIGVAGHTNLLKVHVVD